ncbi:MAG: hypothetical protein KDA22_10210, partial [Phycisphaerales bacterium]|nr:hypothetical protein [Phycisphaerales bacterium]
MSGAGRGAGSRAGERRRHVLAGANLVLLFLGLLALAGEVVFFASLPGWRITIDATKTRAYTLSPQT